MDNKVQEEAQDLIIRHLEGLVEAAEEDDITEYREVLVSSVDTVLSRMGVCEPALAKEIRRTVRGMADAQNINRAF